MPSLVLQLLVFPLGSFAFYYALFSLRPPYPTFEFSTGAPLWCALVAGFFTWMALNKWHGVGHSARDLALARETGFRDGKRAVVSGYIRKKGPALTAPCSGRDCVAYRYEASHYHTTDLPGAGEVRRHNRWLADYRGSAMTPVEVKGAMKTAAILATPDCLKYPEGGSTDEEVPGSDATARLEVFLAAIDHGAEVNDRMEGRPALTRVSTTQPGDFRVDTRAEDPEALGETSKLQEWILQDGDTVLVSGIYHADRGGIGPGENSTLQPLEIRLGGDALLEAQSAGYRGSIRNGLLLSAATVAVYFAFLA